MNVSMNPDIFQNLIPALQNFSLGLWAPRQLLLTEKSSVAVTFDSTIANAEIVAVRSHRRMTTLKRNKGYRHYGIND
jgi:hypothetical protein